MADWVIVVDDDESNLKMAGHILSKAHMRVTTMKSGQAHLNYIRDKEVPDLILLDVKMPGMDGFETLDALRKLEKGKLVPVIFLTADERKGTEVKGLSLGAMDFIKKPFVPEVLNIRVRHMIDLDHLQRNLTEEVDKKTDVGKIGVPDAVINKPAKLTDEEFDIIKNHPVLGARILGNIKEMPSLQMGARWHHERYDGKGYPDGLAGEDIPEEARIIAVADSYDAMTSYRSYRKSLPQTIVREEIEKGMGTQFDPRFAKIMLEMMDEDKEYKMKEE